MKKILLTLVCALLFPLCASAVNYVQISANMESAAFVDNDSISVIRYAPPYYVIQCDERFHDFGEGAWYQATTQYLYDYNTRIIKKRYVSIRRKMDNMPWTNPYTKYDKVDEVKEKQIQWWVANYIFNKAYNIYFSPELQGQNVTNQL